MAIHTLVTVVLGLVSLSHVIKADPPITGTFAPTLAGTCQVNLRAFGNGDTEAVVAYIKVNGLTYLYAGPDWHYRGFNVVTLDMSTCKASKFGHFDTYYSGTEADALATYINDSPDGTHILGVTDDDATNALSDNAKKALKSIGVDVSNMVFHDKVLFHAVKGHPEQTVYKYGPKDSLNLYYEENAVPLLETCAFCKNGGVMQLNAAGTGYECKCLKMYEGVSCEKIRPECAK